MSWMPNFPVEGSPPFSQPIRENIAHLQRLTYGGQGWKAVGVDLTITFADHGFASLPDSNYTALVTALGDMGGGALYIRSRSAAGFVISCLGTQVEPIAVSWSVGMRS